MKLWLALASSATIVVAAACSGSSDTELFGTADGTGVDEPGSGTPPGSSGGGSSGEGGSSSGGSSSGDAGDPAGPEDAGADSGDTKDAGADAAADAGATAQISCGAGATCSADTQICCGRRKANGPSYTCEPDSATSCIAGTKIACDSRADCPGAQLCCGNLSSAAGYTSVSCKAACDDGFGYTGVQLCDPKVAGECAGKKKCEASKSLPGFHVCQD